MNTPNKLTMFRMLLTPVFLAALVIDFDYHFFIALAVFITASVTDMLDGKIARKKGLITDFGKFLDPIADKVLTTSAFLGFIYLGAQSGGGHFGYGIIWIVFIVIVREFIVASIRMLAAGRGKVVAADIFGKAKTVVQMIAVITVLVFEGVFEVWGGIPASVENAMIIAYNAELWFSSLLTVISGTNYIIKNREFIDYRK